ncbi:hypothetical protein BCR43DRAFT_65820 [Syncephalastrum racemosum]|uniref:Uncharacterized protein n=1 Tax=Syncephalastrum racemosum TaxID=13706 RepID=A0A1X2HWE4_SYNRA|nr:hypothetical protein BCR43DRAFT_65820 [Syncephalastrum racemosum]
MRGGGAAVMSKSPPPPPPPPPPGGSDETRVGRLTHTKAGNRVRISIARSESNNRKSLVAVRAVDRSIFIEWISGLPFEDFSAFLYNLLLFSFIPKLTFLLRHEHRLTHGRYFSPAIVLVFCECGDPE